MRPDETPRFCVTQYEAFGNIVSSSGISDNNRLANTKERDESIGLDNHGFRYYDPEIGRYVTPDLIYKCKADCNFYRHVFNNPINRVDPLGLCSGEAQQCSAQQAQENAKKAEVEAAREDPQKEQLQKQNGESSDCRGDNGAGKLEAVDFEIISEPTVGREAKMEGPGIDPSKPVEFPMRPSAFEKLLEAGRKWAEEKVRAREGKSAEELEAEADPDLPMSAGPEAWHPKGGRFGVTGLGTLQRNPETEKSEATVLGVGFSYQPPGGSWQVQAGYRGERELGTKERMPGAFVVVSIRF